MRPGVNNLNQTKTSPSSGSQLPHKVSLQLTFNKCLPFVNRVEAYDTYQISYCRICSSIVRSHFAHDPIALSLHQLPHLLVCSCPIIVILLCWFDLDGPRVVLHRLLPSTHIIVCTPPIIVIPIIPTVDLDGPRIVLECLLVLLHIRVYNPPIRVIASIFIIDSDGFGVVLHRFLVLPHIIVCTPSVTITLSKIALELQGLAVVLDGLLILSSLRLNHSDIEVGIH